MQEETYTIVNKLGLHARASALFVKTATRFPSDIKLGRDGVEVNGKSIMGIMMLAAAKGSLVKLRVEGVDETEAMQSLGEFIDNGFGED